MTKIRFETAYLFTLITTFIISFIAALWAICNADDKVLECGVVGMILSGGYIIILGLLEVLQA